MRTDGMQACYLFIYLSIHLFIYLFLGLLWPSRAGDGMQVKPQLLMKSLEPAGFVWDLHIPKGPEGSLPLYSP